MSTVSNKKFSKVDLYGVSNLMQQLLEEHLISLDECDAILRRMAAENGFSEIDVSLLISHMHEKNFCTRNAEKVGDKV